MEEKTKYYLLKQKAVPEVLLKVAEAEEAHCGGKGDDDSGGDRPAWDQPEFLL